MPPSGFSNRAVKGSLQFIQACYEDLLAETHSGKHASYEEAIEFEIQQIGRALEQLHINEKGRLVERKK